jgi:hypothetical protein
MSSGNLTLSDVPETSLESALCLCLCPVLVPCAGGLNSIQVAAVFVRLTKLVVRQQLRPRDMLALQSVLSQVCWGNSAAQAREYLDHWYIPLYIAGQKTARVACVVHSVSTNKTMNRTFAVSLTVAWLKVGQASLSKPGRRIVYLGHDVLMGTPRCLCVLQEVLCCKRKSDGAHLHSLFRLVVECHTRLEEAVALTNKPFVCCRC